MSTKKVRNENGDVVAAVVFADSIAPETDSDPFGFGIAFGEEITVESTDEVTSKAKIRLKPADPVEVLRKKIANEHTNALTSMIDSVRHAASCGSLLIQAKDAVTDPFRKWVGETLPFTYRTAYRYIRIAEAVADGAISLDGVTSINEALKLLASAAKEDEPEKDKEPKDERIETFVTAAMKIESWFKKETQKAPLSSWSTERRGVVKSQLEGVIAIYEAL